MSAPLHPVHAFASLCVDCRASWSQAAKANANAGVAVERDLSLLTVGDKEESKQTGGSTDRSEKAAKPKLTPEEKRRKAIAVHMLSSYSTYLLTSPHFTSHVSTSSRHVGRLQRPPCERLQAARPKRIRSRQRAFQRRQRNLHHQPPRGAARRQPQWTSSSEETDMYRLDSG